MDPRFDAERRHVKQSKINDTPGCGSTGCGSSSPRKTTNGGLLANENEERLAFFDDGPLVPVTGDCDETENGVLEYLKTKIDDSEPDMVNSPPHYCKRSMEAIDIIEMIVECEENTKVAYNMSNVVKYLLRFRDKGKDLEDLKKARWYLDRMIMHVGREPDTNCEIPTVEKMPKEHELGLPLIEAPEDFYESHGFDLNRESDEDFYGSLDIDKHIGI